MTNEAQQPAPVRPHDAEETAQLLAKALQNYAAPRGGAQRPDTIPMAQTIPGRVRDLMLQRTREPTRRPGEGNASHEKTISELELVARRSAALVAAMEAVHGPALEAINLTERAFRELITKLNILTIAADPEGLPGRTSRAAAGRRPEVVPSEIADRTLVHFRELSGIEATRVADMNKPGGLFHGLLSEVFSILGIKANVDHQAKLAIRRHKERMARD